MHAVRSGLRARERRGELIPLWHMERFDRRTGVTRIPYVRVKTIEQVRRERILRAASLAGLGLAVTGAAIWAMWQVRYLLGAAAGCAALLAMVAILAPHWGRGCTGLHCSGCRG